jgi:hypothetical protein
VRELGAQFSRNAIKKLMHFPAFDQPPSNAANGVQADNIYIDLLVRHGCRPRVYRVSATCR